MSMDKCQLLTDAMDEIVAVAEKYDPLLRPSIVNNLCRAFLASNNTVDEARQQADALEENMRTGSEAVDPNNVAEEIDEYSQKYNLADSKVTNTAFIAFVAFYFSKVVDGKDRVNTISKEHVERACLIVGRKPPKNMKSAFGNAYTKGYIKGVGSESYELTSPGEHFVRHSLLKAET